MSTPEQYAETKQMVRQAMQEEGVSAQALIQIGDLAKKVLEDKSLGNGCFRRDGKAND